MGSGVWLFRGALQGKNLLSSLSAAGTGKEGVVPHSVGGSPAIPRALVRMRMGEAPLSGHVLESGVGHC